MLSRLRIPSAFLAVLLAVSSCHSPAHVESIDVNYVEMNAAGQYKDTAVAAIIAPYKVKLDKEMNEVLGVSDQAMPKEKDPIETLLGDFTADIVLQRARTSINENGQPRTADVCLLNNGGLRSSLPKGELTRGKIFELMPFDNEIVIVTISGAKMRQLAEYAAQNTGIPVAGLKIGVHNLKPTSILINGQALDESRNYTVATSDYLANGGDKMNFLLNAIKTEMTGVRIRDAIIDHVSSETKAGRHIVVKTDGRIYND